MKTRRNLIRDSLCPDQDSNQAIFEYKSEAVPFRAIFLVYEGNNIKENEVAGYVESIGRMKNACKLSV
jgi:hypothetical protein